MVNNAKVLAPDIMAGNGVVHVIDQVLSPLMSILEVAGSMPEAFGTLTELVMEAGLLEALNVEGPLTLFAPTNEAFAALDNETVAYLLNDPAALAEVLLYHVYPGIVLAQDLADGTVLTMANSMTTTIAMSPTNANVTYGDSTAALATEAGYYINDAEIVAADVLATNGVIHIIDSVITPTLLRKYRKA
jgi:transforming growth factor-beta-induced protein